ncbi:MAG: ferric reductase-like transmembrane domain-containing protein [Microthrixaceae bacterium]
MSEQFWWYVARASGMVAAVLVVLTLIWGLLLSTKLIERRGLPAWLTDLHRGLGGLSCAFIGIHLLALWADSYEHFGPAELFVPFASTWKRGPVAWGVVALWMLVVVEGTSLVMRRMPRKVWRGFHYLSYPVGVLVGVHALTAGTDASNPVFIGVTVALGAVLLFLVIYRILSRKGVEGQRPTSRIPASAREAVGR